MIIKKKEVLKYMTAGWKKKNPHLAITQSTKVTTM